MVKCAVSGCPNRTANDKRPGNRSSKRFFSFPQDPVRVKVWLAALRETDKQDLTEQSLICEDHFLTEDIATDGVKHDAIPIMPPYPDGPLGLTSPWGPESPEEEEEQWTTGDCEEDVEEEGGNDAPPTSQPPQQDPVGGVENPPETLKTRSVPPQVKQLIQPKEGISERLSTGQLTRRLLELLVAAPHGSLDVREAAMSLQTSRRRVHNIINVLEDIDLVQKESVVTIKWIGKSSISNFLWRSPQKLRRKLDNMKLVEDALDDLVESCAHQLFSMTDDLEKGVWAYVTHEDISRLIDLKEQTVIIIKAPEETKLDIPSPKEDNIEVHLTGRAPITVLTCELASSDSVTSDLGEKRNVFLALEESGIRTTLLPVPSGPQSPVQRT
ncbi:transcription factor E2F6-like [Channa argus]|uniref:transcription factor E2F6-like n=1 Tax=Channa argus TaxID=215402 RepID=UPI0029457D51|nr:hypothetical protein Q8A73_018078 [Channa argus]